MLRVKAEPQREEKKTSLNDDDPLPPRKKKPSLRLEYSDSSDGQENKSSKNNEENSVDEVEMLIENRFNEFETGFCQEMRRNMELIRNQNQAILEQQEEIKKNSQESVLLLAQVKSLLESTLKQNMLMQNLKELSQNSLEKASTAILTCQKNMAKVRDLHNLMWTSDGLDELSVDGLSRDATIRDNELSQASPSSSPRADATATPEPRKSASIVALNGNSSKDTASSTSLSITSPMHSPVFVLDPVDNTKILLGGMDGYKMGLKEYIGLVSVCKRPSVLIMKLLTQFMSRQELLQYSWKGTTHPMTGQPMKYGLQDMPLMKAILSQVQMQFPDFKMAVNIKKCLSTYCAGYGLAK